MIRDTLADQHGAEVRVQRGQIVLSVCWKKHVHLSSPWTVFPAGQAEMGDILFIYIEKKLKNK